VYNEAFYKQRDRNPMLPMMVPMLTYKIDMLIECVDATGANDMVKVIVMSQTSTVPLITANLQMPVSEVNFE